MTTSWFRSIVAWRIGPGLMLLLLSSAHADTVNSADQPTLVHLAGTTNGWSVAQSENFRILHKDSAALAEQVAQTAEKTRAAMFDKWFGKTPERWAPRCDIWLYPSAAEYSRATGVPAPMPGHSTTHGEGQRITARRIDLRCDYAGLLTALLPHEVTHVVIADRFGEKGAPPWANEGMAVLSEPRDRMAKHWANLPRYSREGKLCSAAQLVRAAEYPAPAQMGSFYAQSVLLVDFLVAQKGARTFMQFVSDIPQSGYAAALEQHYGWSIAQMEQHWLRRVQQEAGFQTVNLAPAGR